MKHVEVTRRAEKDLRQLDKPARRRVAEALRAHLAVEPPPYNADIKALQGAEPWLRLRVGTFRVLYRPLTSTELDELTADVPSTTRPREGYLVDRIVHRRDLDRAVGSL